MQTALVVFVGCIAMVSGLTFHTPVEKVADTEVGNSMYANKNNQNNQNMYANNQQDNNNQKTNAGTQQNDDGIDERFNGQHPTGGALQYNFKQDFEQLINPANQNSDWQWSTISANKEQVFDSGTFLKEAVNSVDLISLPFKSWAPQNDSVVVPLINQYEALITNKQNITVLPGQKLTVAVQFACKTFNNEDQPLPVTAVSNPSDDPTLAACRVALASYDDSALVFSILATNKGVWASYERNRFVIVSKPEKGLKEFAVFQRLASRQSPYEIIDAAIKYDSSKNKVEFLVGGQVKHTITELGTLNHAVKGEELQKAYAEVYTMNREDLVQSQPKHFQVRIGLSEMGDTIDPNNPSNPPVRGVKYTTNPNFYDPKAKFIDNENLKNNSIWGEGASMTLVSAQIKLTGDGVGIDNDSTNNSENTNDGRVNKKKHNKGGRAGRLVEAENSGDDQDQETQ